MSQPSNPDCTPQIAPSLLSADFANLARDVGMVEAGGADLLHVDVMDGHFVPNLTIGPPVVRSIHRAASRPLDVHLMISDPAAYAEEFIRAGASLLSFHVEAVEDPRPLCRRIRQLGARPALAISPPTPFEAVAGYLDEIDMLLVMSVNPGFGGQSFMPEVLDKVRRARQLGPPGLLLEIDGGINRETIGQAAAAGIDVFVAGSAVFGAPDPAAEVECLRGLAYAGRTTGGTGG